MAICQGLVLRRLLVITKKRNERFMSASQDKKRRQAERAAGDSPKTLAEREAAQKAKKERRTWTVVGVILAVFVVVIILLNTNLLYTGTTAMTVGDYEFTNAEYQYYYNVAYNNFAYQNQSYLSFLGLDTSSDLDDQPFTDTTSSYLSMFSIDIPESMTDENRAEDATWADYFRAVALDNMVQVTALWDSAVKAGYTLEDEDAAEIDSTIASFETAAETNNLRGADGYAAVVYGKGVTADLVRELLERAYIAERYSQDIYDGFEYTADELNTYYDENADSFDALTLDYYFVAAETEEVTSTVTDEETGEETEETNDEVTEATMADAEEIANAIADAVEGGTDFADAITAEVEDGEVTELVNVFGYNVSMSFPDAFGEWALDSAREAGDVGVIESENRGYYVIVFHDRSDNTDYNGVNFRHILIQVDDTDEDGELSEEEIAAAEESINTIRDEWVTNGETEEAFAELANSNSDDSSSTAAYGGDGGLYQHVSRNQMVDEINDWIFDSARQPGDSEIIYVEASNYTGYHLVYFVGTDDYTYHDCLAQYGLGTSGAPEGLRRPDYNAWEAELISAYPVSINSFINWFAKV